jgi:hypothetical protein
MKSLTQTARPGSLCTGIQKKNGDRFLGMDRFPVFYGDRRLARDLEIVSGIGSPQVLPPDEDRINQQVLT